MVVFCRTKRSNKLLPIQQLVGLPFKLASNLFFKNTVTGCFYFLGPALHKRRGVISNINELRRKFMMRLFSNTCSSFLILPVYLSINRCVQNWFDDKIHSTKIPLAQSLYTKLKALQTFLCQIFDSGTFPVVIPTICIEIMVWKFPSSANNALILILTEMLLFV